jgi:replicative DNA helicase
VTTPSDIPPSRRAPVSLANMQVDVTTRLGALQKATATGLPMLDRILAGGLRGGTLLTVAGAPGIGKTALALFIGYMAARAKAATVFVSPVIDETEVVARLAARALHREQPESTTSYGAIWSGEAWQDSATLGSVRSAVDTVIKKVGDMFHVFRADPFESTAVLSTVATQMLSRHERVVLIVDGIDAFSAEAGGDAARVAAANASSDNRVQQVGYELRRLAEAGAAIIATVPLRHADVVAPAATVATDLRNVEGSPVPLAKRQISLGARPMELVVRKNHVGPTGIVPLRFMAGAATFEERGP